MKGGINISTIPVIKIHRIGKIIDKNLVWLPLLVLVAWTTLPLLWSLSASFKQPLELYKLPQSLIPKNFNFDNYIKVFAYPNFWRYFANSTILALSSTILTLFISIFAAYGFARYAFRFRHTLLLVMLIPRIVPRVSMIVPLYQLVASLGLLDSYIALIITYTATAIPLATWILTGFISGVPKELEEAAAIDGANLWQRIRYIVMPIALPGILTVIVLSLRESWNEFPFVLAFTTSSEMRTLPYQLFMLRDCMGILDWPMVNAFTIVTILPILFIYLRFEKNVVSGIVAGAMKS